MLSQELSPLKSAVDGLQAELANLSVSVEARLAAVEARVDTTQVRIEKLEVWVAEAKQQPGEAVTSPEVIAKLQGMQKQIDELVRGRPAADAEQNACTAVVGGLAGFGTISEASAWLNDKLTALTAPIPVDTYIKGGTFNGLLFAKFRNKLDRDAAVLRMRSASYQYGGNPVWARPDLPIEKRVPEGFLFGFKRQLVEWGFQRSIVRIDTDALNMKVGSELAVTAGVANGRLQCQWHGAWATWEDLHGSSELDVMMKKANDAIQRSRGVGKGTTKGHTQ